MYLEIQGGNQIELSYFTEKERDWISGRPKARNCGADPGKQGLAQRKGFGEVQGCGSLESFTDY